jgi:hypothetical protein
MRVSDSAVGGDADQVAKLEVGNRALIGVETLVLSTPFLAPELAVMLVDQQPVGISQNVECFYI